MRLSQFKQEAKIRLKENCNSGERLSVGSASMRLELLKLEG